MEQYRQVGNAAPVRLGQVAGEVIAKALDAVYENGLRPFGGDHPRLRRVYVKAHVRTRKWYEDGKAVLWREGEDNAEAMYSPARKVTEEEEVTCEY